MANGKKTFPCVKTDSLEWVFVNRNRPVEMNELRRRYRYSPLDLREILPPLQRPKVVARDGYIFMILLYPIFDRTTREIRSTEVDFFISADRLVSVNVDGYEPIVNLFESTTITKHGPHVCMSGDITQLLYALLNEMTAAVFPMLVHISNDIDAIERRLFEDYEKNLIQELLRIKTNVVNIRKTMQAHKTVIRKLMQIAPGYFPNNMLQEYFDELVDHTKEIWDSLEVQKETVDALHETNQSLIDFRINEIIKTLTIISVIMFPLTLTAAVFGMNTTMPLVDEAFGFWKILALMVFGAAGMVAYFKYRKWI